MTKVHLIKDESIGGIQREFIEVDRVAEVGDYVICLSDAHDLTLGNSYKIVGLMDSKIREDNGRQFLDDTGHKRAFWGRDKYTTLGPSDIVHIEGTRYQLAERKAEVGEKVIVINSEQEISAGTIGTCTVNNEFDDGSIDTDLVHTQDGFIDAALTKYSVLIPVDSEPAEPTPDIHDLIANLAQRVTSLERITGELVRAKSSLESQLRDTQNNVQTFAEQTEANTKDIAFLDERTYEKAGKPTKSAEEILREISKIIERDDKRCNR